MSVMVITVSRSSEYSEREANQSCPGDSESCSGVREKSHLDFTSAVPLNHCVPRNDKKSGKVELLG